MNKLVFSTLKNICPFSIQCVSLFGPPERCKGLQNILLYRFIFFHRLIYLLLTEDHSPDNLYVIWNNTICYVKPIWWFDLPLKQRSESYCLNYAHKTFPITCHCSFEISLLLGTVSMVRKEMNGEGKWKMEWGRNYWVNK